ncbi:MAG: DNA-processing protein DprA [Erysipelotrichaceae bacterium]
MRNKLIAYAYKYHGEWDRIAQALANNEVVALPTEVADCLVLGDPHYPPAFLSLQKPPFVIFYKGNVHLLAQVGLCVIGTRTPSAQGVALCEVLFAHLPQNLVIVSGLAKGIDALAHQHALRRHQRCIGVVGSGLEVVYPKENAGLWQQMQHQLLLSEYPPHSAPLRHHFIMRNRLLAALGQALVVVEAKAKSGTMHTVSQALALGKEIYVFPHSWFNEQGMGCNILIEEGANVLKEPDDIRQIIHNL